ALSVISRFAPLAPDCARRYTLNTSRPRPGVPPRPRLPPVPSAVTPLSPPIFWPLARLLLVVIAPVMIGLWFEYGSWPETPPVGLTISSPWPPLPTPTTSATGPASPSQTPADPGAAIVNCTAGTRSSDCRDSPAEFHESALKYTVWPDNPAGISQLVDADANSTSCEPAGNAVGAVPSAPR